MKRKISIQNGNKFIKYSGIYLEIVRKENARTRSNNFKDLGRVIVVYIGWWQNLGGIHVVKSNGGQLGCSVG